MKGGNRLYVSQALQDLWPFGFCSIGDVTFESAAYVARYITKKVTGKASLLHYTDIDSRGEVLRERRPEYNIPSRRPGLARGWFEKYKDDVFPGDFVVLRAQKMRPPKYYDRLYDMVAPVDAARIKSLRTGVAKTRSDNNTLDRLEVRETIQLEKFKRLKRSYEKNGT